MAWFEHAGSRISYEVEGSGQPVLLLPGFTGRIADMGPLRADLATLHAALLAGGSMDEVYLLLSAMQFALISDLTDVQALVMRIAEDDAPAVRAVGQSPGS